MKYIATRTIHGPSIQKQRVISQECKNIRAAGQAIYHWLTINGYEARQQAKATAYQAEQDKEYTGYGSTWTITPAKQAQEATA